MKYEYIDVKLIAIEYAIFCVKNPEMGVNFDYWFLNIYKNGENV